MTTKYGMFREPGYLNSGTPYKGTQLVAGEKESVLNFKTPTAKVGRNNDACFDKLKPLFVGEKHIDPTR